jgi:two-component system sensor histidine kinase UhpB
MSLPPRSDRGEGDRRFVSLFWRIFVPNLLVLLVAGTVLWLEPANGRPIALAGGVLAMVLVNVLLLRRAFAPLARLTSLMESIDPLQPGDRLPDIGPASEVSLLTRSFNRMLDRLEGERRESARRELAAQERERARIARELHDEIGQNLTAMAMLLKRLADEAPAPIAARIVDARGSMLDTVDDVRRVARQLRPDLLDDLGLTAALTTLCQRMEETTGVHIARQLPREPPALSPEVETVLYRVVQESLTNAARHSGATDVLLTLRAVDGGAIDLTVTDNGIGFPSEIISNGGIRGMRERALLIGGTLELGPADPAGARVALHVPRGGIPG